MNGRVIQIFCMVVGIVLASSCGDECPVEQPYSVRVSVKDKNYLNISQFPQLGSVDENQPFRTYTGTIYYALYDASTGALKKSRRLFKSMVKIRSILFLSPEYPMVIINWLFGGT